MSAFVTNFEATIVCMPEFETPIPEISIAAPAYNEAEGIEAVVREWCEVLRGKDFAFEVVICNDGSSDGTDEVLERLRNDVPELRAVGGATNRGYGSAVSTAIAACRGRYIATIDSDGQFDPCDIASMHRLLVEQKADGVNGIRDKKNDTWLRVAADRALNLIVRLLFGTRLRDTNCALKLIERSKLQSLELLASGFPLPTEICLRLEEANARLIETTILHRERLAGESKLAVWSTGLRMLSFLLYLRREFRLRRRGILQNRRSPDC